MLELNKFGNKVLALYATGDVKVKHAEFDTLTAADAFLSEGFSGEVDEIPLIIVHSGKVYGYQNQKLEEFHEVPKDMTRAILAGVGFRDGKAGTYTELVGINEGLARMAGTLPNAEKTLYGMIGVMHSNAHRAPLVCIINERLLTMHDLAGDGGAA